MLFRSPFRDGAHAATASRAYQDRERVAAVLADPATAPVEEPLRATLLMLGKLIRAGTLSAADVRQVLAAGVSPEQVRDALAVCAAFDTTNRLGTRSGAEPPAPDRT